MPQVGSMLKLRALTRYIGSSCHQQAAFISSCTSEPSHFRSKREVRGQGQDQPGGRLLGEWPHPGAGRDKPNQANVSRGCFMIRLWVN